MTQLTAITASIALIFYYFANGFIRTSISFFIIQNFNISIAAYSRLFISLTNTTIPCLIYNKKNNRILIDSLEI